MSELAPLQRGLLATGLVGLAGGAAIGLAANVGGDVAAAHPVKSVEQAANNPSYAPTRADVTSIDCDNLTANVVVERKPGTGFLTDAYLETSGDGGTADDFDGYQDDGSYEFNIADNPIAKGQSTLNYSILGSARGEDFYDGTISFTACVDPTPDPTETTPTPDPTETTPTPDPTETTPTPDPTETTPTPDPTETTPTPDPTETTPTPDPTVTSSAPSSNPTGGMTVSDAAPSASTSSSSQGVQVKPSEGAASPSSSFVLGEGKTGVLFPESNKNNDSTLWLVAGGLATAAAGGVGFRNRRRIVNLTSRIKRSH